MDELNLLDFGTNDKGEYVNLVEEEKRLKDISEKEFINWVNSHHDPLVKIAYDLFYGYYWKDYTFNELKERLENIVESKCYHWANMSKNMYVFSLKGNGKIMLMFENENHYVANELQLWKLEYGSYGKLVDVGLDDYLLSKETMSFPALHCHCYDTNGNRLHQYADGKDYKEDIRHIVCIKEWNMDKFSKNRMNADKKIKDFYEVEFTWDDFTNYWGESENGNKEEEV